MESETPISKNGLITLKNCTRHLLNVLYAFPTKKAILWFWEENDNVKEKENPRTSCSGYNIYEIEPRIYKATVSKILFDIEGCYKSYRIGKIIFCFEGVEKIEGRNCLRVQLLYQLLWKDVP